MSRLFLILIWILLMTLMASAQTTFYFPQIAHGTLPDRISWTTTILLTNPASLGSPAVSGTMTFTTSAGAPFNISLVQRGGVGGVGSRHSFSLSGGQTLKLVSTGASALAMGYATVVTSTGTVTGTIIFSEFNPDGLLISEAAVPATTANARQAIFVDMESGFDTAVAYANPNVTPVTITLQLLSSQGMALGAPVEMSLGAGQHTAAFVSQLFAARSIAGTMQITASAPLAAIALRFSPAGLFTTLPPISIADLLSPR